jgi:dTDP-4-amino-4,6-dideoxygalactose transaminase
MIPLIRPIFPAHDVAIEHFLRSREARQFSNYGPAHEAVTAQLSGLTMGLALPTISGTAALEIALRVSFPAGARVALPDFTHTGTIVAVARAGMVPVLFGVDDKTWCLRPREIERSHGCGDVDGAIVVNPFGYGVDLAAWENLSFSAGLPLVYDFAGAWGSTATARNPICYSLHATKNLGIGEGGVMVFGDGGAQFHAARRLMNFDTLPDRSIASLDGSNAKMDELRCAYLLAALEPGFRDRAAGRSAAKKIMLKIYRERLPGTWSPTMGPDSFPSLCVLGGLPATALEQAKTGATFRAYYPLLSRMPALAGVERISVSGDTMTTCCALPSDVTLDEAFKVIDIVCNFAGAAP